ncbi:MAG: IS66 family insertion sequence element accessory protein TnpB [Nitrosomonas sp.]|jgi:transposase-like protein|nr:IS66 family insertion sequence element accessory protein TnpB [Nitrosomonas sp.]
MALQDDKQKHISSWQASGLSQAAYCRALGLNAKTFGNWLRAHRRGRDDIKLPALIPVTIKPAAASVEVLQLRCRGTHVLELPLSVSPRWLGELLSCLG